MAAKEEKAMGICIEEKEVVGVGMMGDAGFVVVEEEATGISVVEEEEFA